MKKLAMTVAVAAMVAAGATQAATNGGRGPTSTGDIGVTVEIGDNVIVTQLEDILLGTFAGADMNGSEDFCIGQNYTGDVSVTISSPNAVGTGPNDWRMIGSTGGVLPYEVTWRKDLAPQPFQQGLPEVVAMGPAQQDLNCLTTNNTIDVLVRTGDASAAVQDSYSDQITVMVAAQ